MLLQVEQVQNHPKEHAFVITELTQGNVAKVTL